MTLSRLTRQTLSWWIDNITTSEKPVHRGQPDISLESDSSGSGWGGVVRDDPSLQTGGHWSYIEQSKHINYLELLAAFLTLQCFCGDKSAVHVSLYLDNTVAVNYINNMGGKKPELSQLTRDIWLWSIRRNIWLSACHLPGSQNTRADNLSRKLSDDMEWHLAADIFEDLCLRFNRPCVDLFATRVNTQVNSYVSYLPDPTAIAIGAFTIPWSNFHMCYAFPPFSVLGRVLQKVEEEETPDILLVAPLWTTQPWFPALLRLLIDNPVILPNSRPILHLINKPGAIHPLQNLRLIACRLSGKVSKNEEFHRSLQTLSSPLGGNQLKSNMGSISANGCHFVVGDRLIHFVHLSQCF
ncbi:uncharacterized protein LOC132545090 [Ylistrum balloti]|uniref:uncharacterized protein LOC132545090 n=1 Tax=Ylistrum balloti TaxID=509963 RepID=UPI002905B31B|nr:uncharacterized protein LOC132545090 [Ylistrum balloti]